MSLSPAFYLMKTVTQPYQWGSVSSLEAMFGLPNPKREPQAELWMGTHPNGCSLVQVDGQWQSLQALIDSSPDTLLGQRTYQSFGGLPFLFKVLAADKALSIQVHPSKQQAEQGFAREQAAGIALDAANRNYKDPNHKPELVYALTPYQAMNGFRAMADIVSLFHRINIAVIAPLVDTFAANQTSQGLARFFQAILSLDGDDKSQALAALASFAHWHQADAPFALIAELTEQYPDDIGLFAPLMLNVVKLQPGQAMFLDACTPHAYIKGTGLEIMANSDNVLRAGLTPKFMDVDELVACTRFESKSIDALLMAPEESDNAKHFPVPVSDFRISLYRASHALFVESAEVIFAVDSPLMLTAEGQSLSLDRGQCAFIPASTSSYYVASDGQFARAYS